MATPHWTVDAVITGKGSGTSMGRRGLLAHLVRG